jgi:hypothetical protein
MELRKTLKITDEKNGPHDSENLRGWAGESISLFFRADSFLARSQPGRSKTPFSRLILCPGWSPEPPLCGRDCGRGVHRAQQNENPREAGEVPERHGIPPCQLQNHRLVHCACGLAGFGRGSGSKTRRPQGKTVENRGLRRSHRQAIMMTAMFTHASSPLQIEAARLLAAISCMPAASSRSAALAGASQPLR